MNRSYTSGGIMEAPAVHRPAADTSLEDPLDRDYIRDNYEAFGCLDMFLDILRLFADSAPQKLENIRHALEQSRIDDVIRIAHNLKGDSASATARQVYSLAALLESTARSGDLEAARHILAPLDTAIGRAVSAAILELADRREPPDAAHP